MALTRPINRRQELLKDTTLREYDGGLNVVDTDLNLSAKYQTKLQNMFRAQDGALVLRWGTRKFFETTEIDKIINLTYYNKHLIVVGRNGIIEAVNGEGVGTVIWAPEFAATLPGNPPGWGTDIFIVTFAEFNGDLIIANGLDKPVIVDANLLVDYLNDPATGSNTNTPIARFVITTSNYLVMAGDLAEPDLLCISNIGTSGVWLNDQAPNDAVNINIGSRVTMGSSNIKGIQWFRDTLLIFCAECTLAYQLGTYNDNGDHEPTFVESIENYGSISHRTSQSLGNDVLFVDNVGVPSIQRALFTGQLRPDRVSQLIDPLIQRELFKLNTIAQEDRVFSVYHHPEGQYFLFIPNTNSEDAVTETKCFVYTVINELKVKAWAQVRQWKWNAACQSEGDRLFFASDNKIFVYGNQLDPIYSDFVGDEETFSDGTTFSDGHGWSPVSDPGNGVPIWFDAIMPWGDFGRRNNTKAIKFLKVETEGTSRFSVDMFTDNILFDPEWVGEEFSDGTLYEDGLGHGTSKLDGSPDPKKLDYANYNSIPYAPALTLDFLAGEYPFFGLDGFGNQYSGAPSDSERLYTWPAKAKIVKPRVYGASTGDFKLVSLGLSYTDGSVRGK